MIAEQVPLLPAVPSMRRVWCHCGCGVWFYVERAGRGRKLEYANPDHYRREYNRRRRARRAS